MGREKIIIEKLIFVILAILPIVFVPVGDMDYFYSPKVNVMRIIALVFMILVFQHRYSLNKIISWDRINQLLLAYFAWLAISTVFSVNILNSLFGIPFRVEGLFTIMLYMILFLIARNQGEISKKNLYAMLVTGCVIVVYGIFQAYGFEFFPRDLIRKTWIKPFSTIGNPNFLGSYIVLLLPFAIHLYLVIKDRWGMIIYSILFYGLLTTMTRGAWVAAFISVLLYGLYILLYRQRFQIKNTEIVIMILITFACFTVFDISNSGSFLMRVLSIFFDLGNLVAGENIEYVGTNRLFIWLKSIELISMRPWVGFGLENLHIAMNQFYKEEIFEVYKMAVQIDKAHSEYLHIAVTTGIPALLIYLTFIGEIIKKGVTRLKSTPYNIPLLTSVIGYLLQAFFNISVVSVAYIFWLFLGFIASNPKIDQH